MLAWAWAQKWQGRATHRTGAGLQCGAECARPADRDISRPAWGRAKASLPSQVPWMGDHRLPPLPAAQRALPSATRRIRKSSSVRVRPPASDTCSDLLRGAVLSLQAAFPAPRGAPNLTRDWCVAWTASVLGDRGPPGPPLHGLHLHRAARETQKGLALTQGSLRAPLGAPPSAWTTSAAGGREGESKKEDRQTSDDEMIFWNP